MKATWQKDHIRITSPKLTFLLGITSGTPKEVKAATLFPFIIIRSEKEHRDNPWLLTHERIHLQQQRETLLVGAFIIDLLERLYARFVLKKSDQETYLWLSSEQEAYRNHHDPQYLTKRKTFARFRYIKNKKAFIFGKKSGEVIVADWQA